MPSQSRGFKIAAAALGCLLAVGSAEVVLRVFFGMSEDLGHAFRAFDPLGVEIEPHGEGGYRPRPGAIFEYRNGTRSTIHEHGYRGSGPSSPATPDTRRIVLVGGSTAHGWGVNDDGAIDAHLVRALANRGIRAEVYNLAFDGYDSWQCLQRLRSDAAKLDPHAVVLHTGINDVRNAKIEGLEAGDRRSILWATVLDRLKADRERGGPSLWTRLKHRSYLARFPGFLRHLRRLRPTEGATDGIPVFDDAERVFLENLGSMPEAVTSRPWWLGSTPPSRLALDAGEPPQGVSYWLNDARETEAYRRRLARSLRGWTDSLPSGGYVAARVDFDDFLDDCHLTVEGNRKVAEAMANWLVPRLAEED